MAKVNSGLQSYIKTWTKFAFARGKLIGSQGGRCSAVDGYNTAEERNAFYNGYIEGKSAFLVR